LLCFNRSRAAPEHCAGPGLKQLRGPCGELRILWWQLRGETWHPDPD